MFNNFFRVYVIETKLDFVSFADKNIQRRRKIVGERDFPRQTSSDKSGSMSESQQGPEICHVISESNKALHSFFSIRIYFIRISRLKFAKS